MLRFHKNGWLQSWVMFFMSAFVMLVSFYFLWGPLCRNIRDTRYMMGARPTPHLSQEQMDNYRKWQKIIPTPFIP